MHKWATQIVNSARYEGCKAKIQLVVDGAYATRNLLKAMSKLNVIVLSRLRSNSCLYDLPSPPIAGKRGRPRKYGKNKINLAQQAKCDDGWETLEYMSRGQKAKRQVKSFLATTKIATGPIRVVIVRYDQDQWGSVLQFRSQHGREGHTRRDRRPLGDRRVLSRCEGGVASRQATGSQPMVQ